MMRRGFPVESRSYQPVGFLRSDKSRRKLGEEVAAVDATGTSSSVGPSGRIEADFRNALSALFHVISLITYTPSLMRTYPTGPTYCLTLAGVCSSVVQCAHGVIGWWGLFAVAGLSIAFFFKGNQTFTSNTLQFYYRIHYFISAKYNLNRHGLPYRKRKRTVNHWPVERPQTRENTTFQSHFHRPRDGKH